MKINTPKTFIVIDDDPTNNLVCRKYIRLVFREARTETFTDPQHALEQIQRQYQSDENNIVLFLDINMPILNGWDVLDRIEQFPDNIKEQFTIYMFSTSLDVTEKQKAQNNPLVTDFILKPLSVPLLKKVFGLE